MNYLNLFYPKQIRKFEALYIKNLGVNISTSFKTQTDNVLRQNSQINKLSEISLANVSSSV